MKKQFSLVVITHQRCLTRLGNVQVVINLIDQSSILNQKKNINPHEFGLCNLIFNCNLIVCPSFFSIWQSHLKNKFIDTSSIFPYFIFNTLIIFFFLEFVPKQAEWEIRAQIQRRLKGKMLYFNPCKQNPTRKYQPRTISIKKLNTEALLWQRKAA